MTKRRRASSFRARGSSCTPRLRFDPRIAGGDQSVNVDGTLTLLSAAAEAGVRRVVFVSSTAVYGVPDKHPIEEDDPLHGVGHYGESKIEAEDAVRAFMRRGLDCVILRPKTFIGPERLGVFEILFDWIRDGRRIYTLGDGSNRYQLLAVEDLVDAILLSASKRTAAWEMLNVGAKEFGTVREDLQALIDHAGSKSLLTPIPVRPRRGRAPRARARAPRRSSSGTTRPPTATRSSTSRARRKFSGGSRSSRMPKR